MKTVFVLTSGSQSDWKPVVEMFKTRGWIVSTKIRPACDIDLLCFCGGSDVSPHLYGEENTSSYCNPVRDEYEKEMYEWGEANCIPMVGICRGGQFLNVMNGGKMIQHIEGHSMGDREIVLDLDFDSAPTSQEIREDHHQGMMPHPHSFDLGWDSRDKNPEIVWYPETRCLCFQPHPEWGHEPTKELFFNLIKGYIG